MEHDKCSLLYFSLGTIPSIPLALLYNSFLNRFIAGFTGGAFR